MPVPTNDTASEAVFVQELELDANVIRQCALSATDDNRAEERAAFVDQACGFGAPRGGPLSESNWKRSVRWTAATRAVSVPGFRVHDLRHTAASV